MEAIVEAATRVFREEGWDATTNRIAERAGVSIGSLYEYFPSKEALLLHIAERHVATAEAGVDAALATAGSAAALVENVQSALLASQRFPSMALDLVKHQEKGGAELFTRATNLRARVLKAFEAHARAAGHADPGPRALAAFSAMGPLTCQAMFEHPDQLDTLATLHRAMALGCLQKT